ncbi:hypothetical protein JM946_22810 [Steroidobacter sp. S1-65]|uniref:Uncharacterized protein n=1 Tax=Steroidobacter gossypii TaxID=2805490 RepID=A0ABS1X2Y4_9GAMM|nr:hypothetical protein [Steroidobacter gossypii]MBM0107583.1 hypothetical protein [Steroidobacter gossypii]
MTEPTDKRPLDEADEQQLEHYLKGDSRVSRRYRELPGVEVPPSLDRLVLGRAQEAVKHRSSRPVWVRWSAPFAVAASAVLALAIVIETGVRDETTVSSVLRTQQKMQIEAAEQSAPPTAPLDVPAPSQLTREEQRAQLKGEELRAAERREEPGPAPKGEESRAALKREEPSAVETRVPAPAAAPAPRPAAPAFAPAPPPPEARSKRYVTNEAPGSAQAASASQSDAKASADQTDVEASAGAAEAEDERIAVQRMMREEQSLSAASRGAVDTRAPVAVYSRPISANMSAPRTYLDPEEWLKDIRQLRKENKQEQADREWRRFRAAYPNHEVAETDLAREAER